MALAFGLYFGLELLTALVAMLILKKTVWDMAGPYIAYATPILFLPASMWLRYREDRGDSVKRLTLLWGLSGGLLCIFCGLAFAYTAMHLKLFQDSDFIQFSLFFATPIGAAIVGFTMYRRIKPIILARRAADTNDCEPSRNSR